MQCIKTVARCAVDFGGLKWVQTLEDSSGPKLTLLRMAGFACSLWVEADDNWNIKI